MPSTSKSLDNEKPRVHSRDMDRGKHKHDMQDSPYLTDGRPVPRCTICNEPDDWKAEAGS